MLLGFYNKVENVSYVVQGFEQTPTKLPEDLPWVILPTNELFKVFFDGFIEEENISHIETMIRIQENIMKKNIESLPFKSYLTEKDRKEREKNLEAQLLHFESSKQSYILNIRSQFLKLSETPELPTLLKINKFYVVRIRGIYCTDLQTYMSNTFDGEFLGKVMNFSFVEILIKFLNLYLIAYDWRMENYTELQKFIFNLKDILLGTTTDYKYITDVLCPKLYALVDRDSVMYTNLTVKLEENKITSTVEMNTFDDKLVVDRTEEMEWSFPPLEIIVKEKPENVDLVYTSQIWKSEAWVLLPLLINFFIFIPGPNPELRNNVDLFAKTIRECIDSHICPSIEKVIELIDYCFKNILLDYKEIFTKIIYTILYSPEGTVKENFNVDVRKIVEILNQYVQAV